MPRVHTFTVPHQAEDGATVQWTYKCGLPPVMVQHEILRRVAPPVGARVAQAFAGGFKMEKGLGPQVIGQIVAALNDIKREDHDWVVNELMRSVQVQRGSNTPWADIWNTSVPFDQAMMFADISLMEFYEIVREVVEHTYGDFMVAYMRKFPAPPPEA